MSLGSPDIPTPKNLPTPPTVASFISRGSSGASFGTGAFRPLTPVVGTSRSVVGRPSLLGGTA